MQVSDIIVLTVLIAVSNAGRQWQQEYGSGFARWINWLDARASGAFVSMTAVRRVPPPASNLA